MDLDLAKELAVTNDSKIVLYVVDGLGGLPHPDTGRSELEAADTPHLDRLASDGICGLTVPVGPGITPGSGPGHPRPRRGPLRLPAGDQGARRRALRRAGTGAPFPAGAPRQRTGRPPF